MPVLVSFAFSYTVTDSLFSLALVPIQVLNSREVHCRLHIFNADIAGLPSKGKYPDPAAKSLCTGREID